MLVAANLILRAR
jgi:MFS transporter, SHS family, lactate transporter